MMQNVEISICLAKNVLLDFMMRVVAMLRPVSISGGLDSQNACSQKGTSVF